MMMVGWSKRGFAISFRCCGTHLSDLSVGSLVDALKSNTVVTSLDLSHNFISAEGAALLAQLLEVNTTVQQIASAPPWHCPVFLMSREGQEMLSYSDSVVVLM